MTVETEEVTEEVVGSDVATIPTHAAAAMTGLWELGVVADMNGLELRDDGPALTLSSWEWVGQALLIVQGSMQFCIGDWINWGEGMFGEEAAQSVDSSPADRVDQALAMTYRDPQTLMNWASVARKVSKSRRKLPRLSYEHHAIVAPFEPDEQTEWLQKAIEGGWKTRDLKQAIKDAYSPPRTDDDDNDDDNVRDDGDGLTVSQRIEQTARRIFHQATPVDGGMFVPDEPWAPFASALGEGD